MLFRIIVLPLPLNPFILLGLVYTCNKLKKIMSAVPSYEVGMLYCVLHVFEIVVNPRATVAASNVLCSKSIMIDVYSISVAKMCICLLFTSSFNHVCTFDFWLIETIMSIMASICVVGKENASTFDYFAV